MSKKIQKNYINVNGIMLISHGRIQVTTKNRLEEFPIGSLISYETNDGCYAKGGFIIKFKDDYFIWITLDFTKKYRIRYNKINRMWVGDVFNVTGDYISFKQPDKKAKYVVKIDNLTVKSFSSKHHELMFMSTEKYNTMVKWHDMFVKKDADVKKSNVVGVLISQLWSSKNVTKQLHETLNKIINENGAITKIILYRENTKYTNHDKQEKAVDAIKNYVKENKIDYNELQSKQEIEQESNVIITLTAMKEAISLVKKTIKVYRIALS